MPTTKPHEKSQSSMFLIYPKQVDHYDVPGRCLVYLTIQRGKANKQYSFEGRGF